MLVPQETQYIDSVLDPCWTTVYDTGPDRTGIDLMYCAYRNVPHQALYADPMLVQCWPPSATMGQHSTNIGLKPRASWDVPHRWFFKR